MKMQLIFAQQLRCWILTFKLMLLVIDEVQMLEDIDRGGLGCKRYYWCSSKKKVVMTGSVNAFEAVKR